MLLTWGTMEGDEPGGRIVSTSMRGTAPTREDLVLLAVPALYLPAFAVGIATPIPLYIAMGVASVFAGAAVVDAVVVHPPTERGRRGPE